MYLQVSQSWLQPQIDDWKFLTSFESTATVSFESEIVRWMRRVTTAHHVPTEGFKSHLAGSSTGQWHHLRSFELIWFSSNLIWACQCHALSAVLQSTDMIETLLEDMRWVKTYGPNIFVGLPSIYQHYRHYQLKIGVPVWNHWLWPITAITAITAPALRASRHVPSDHQLQPLFPTDLPWMRMAEWLNKSIYHMKNVKKHVKKHGKLYGYIWMISWWTLTESSTAARFREPFICLSVWPWHSPTAFGPQEWSRNEVDEVDEVGRFHQFPTLQGDGTKTTRSKSMAIESIHV